MSIHKLARTHAVETAAAAAAGAVAVVTVVVASTHVANLNEEPKALTFPCTSFYMPSLGPMV